jgi:hypothetical protein
LVLWIGEYTNAGLDEFSFALSNGSEVRLHAAVVATVPEDRSCS